MLIRFVVSSGLFLACIAVPLDAQDKDTLSGKFIPVYLHPSHDSLAEWYDIVKADSTAETVVDYLNETIKLPFDIPLRFQECGKANAFYSRSDHSISFCYEFLEYFQQVFSGLNRSDSATNELVIGNMYFILFHEVGHALVHALKLPVLSGEESDVDGLATYLLASDATDDSFARQAVEASVQFFFLRAKEGEGKRLSEIRHLLADEHALDGTRFVQIACWLYGENPARYQSYVRPDLLPAPNATRCEGDYEQLKSSSARFLAGFLKGVEPDSTK